MLYQTIEKIGYLNKIEGASFLQGHLLCNSHVAGNGILLQYAIHYGKNSTGERVRAYKDLQDDNAESEILFTVDILNEGVDILGVNMVLFLRPMDS